ncbi:MAG: thermonuclease family protein [Campylobacterota bacterium]|nr:thermonuclease family protein [Campylobacterota bacterium]
MVNIRQLVVLLTVVFSLKASEIGLLLEVKNNSLFYFSIKNTEHLCVPYAIVTFEMLLHKSQKNTICHQSLLKYYENFPQDKFFAQGHFHRQQQYILEKKKGYCIIHAQGKKSYAALLLKKGLAIVPIHFKDKHIEFKYRRIENQAKIEKKGLWKDPILRNCIRQIEL